MKIYLLNRVENIVSKEEIACFEQFLHLSQSFQNASAAEASERIYMWERITELSYQAKFYGEKLNKKVLCKSFNKSSIHKTQQLLNHQSMPNEVMLNHRFNNHEKWTSHMKTSL